MQDAMWRYVERLRADRGLNLQVRIGINIGEVVVRSIQTGTLTSSNPVIDEGFTIDKGAPPYFAGHSASGLLPNAHQFISRVELSFPPQGAVSTFVL